MSRTVSIVAVVALVLLAGCSGGGGGQQAATTNASTTATTTTTNATTNTTTTAQAVTVSSFAYPTGANQSGLEAGTLAETHVNALLDAGSFTAVRNSSMQFARGSMPPTRVRSNVSASGVLRTRSLGSGGTQTAWSPAGNATAYTRFKSGFSTSYFVNDQGVSPNSALHSEGVSSLLSAASWNAASGVVTVDGTQTVKYTSDSLAKPRALQGVVYGQSYSNFSAAVYVSERGIVKRVHFSVDMSGSNGGPTEMTRTVTFENVGSADTAAPDWVHTAATSGVRTNATFSDNRSVLALTLTSGSLQKGAPVSVSGRPPLSGQLPKKVSAGDTIYLTERNGRLAVTVNQKPSNPGSSFGRFVQVRITTSDHQTTLYTNTYQ